MPTVQLKAEIKYSRKMNKLVKMLNDKDVKINVNQFIADAIQPYVPKKSGKLRDTLYVGPRVISWGRGLDYAHYQFEGEVYGPNYPGIEKDGSPGWRSASIKHPTGRELGAFKGILMLSPKWQVTEEGDYIRPQSFEPIPYEFGYTTDGTRHHWTEVYQWKLKSDTNKKITRYLKQECKKRGLNR
ncbi:MAG: hypothetical protein IKN54_01115 [Lachnospiraceae bacterium]|nr:hypothetical protein [Lachnospiraceae bacterium]